MLEKENPAIGKAIQKLERISSDEELQYWAEMREKAERDELALIRAAEDRGMEQGVKQGMEQGVKQGMEQGVKQGIEQGIERGKSERTNAIAVAMKKKGMPISDIAECTGLSPEEIEKL